MQTSSRILWIYFSRYYVTGSRLINDYKCLNDQESQRLQTIIVAEAPVVVVVVVVAAAAAAAAAAGVVQDAVIGITILTVRVIQFTRWMTAEGRWLSDQGNHQNEQVSVPISYYSEV